MSACPESCAELAALGTDTALLTMNRDTPRFARQQLIEAALVAFRPDTVEADELLQAWFKGLERRYGDHPQWSWVGYGLGQIQIALGKLEEPV